MKDITNIIKLGLYFQAVSGTNHCSKEQRNTVLVSPGLRRGMQTLHGRLGNPACSHQQLRAPAVPALLSPTVNSFPIVLPRPSPSVGFSATPSPAALRVSGRTPGWQPWAPGCGACFLSLTAAWSKRRRKARRDGQLCLSHGSAFAAAWAPHQGTVSLALAAVLLLIFPSSPLLACGLGSVTLLGLGQFSYAGVLKGVLLFLLPLQTVH